MSVEAEAKRVVAQIGISGDLAVVAASLIAKALCAERERCARVADEWERTAFGFGAPAVKAAARAISESIRNSK